MELIERERSAELRAGAPVRDGPGEAALVWAPARGRGGPEEGALVWEPARERAWGQTQAGAGARGLALAEALVRAPA